ncbi:tetratricopeptide repeat protein [Rhodopirellula sp. JC639]|uniref:tetratricopeptide repeat protein n=1 Tax=Stieleria mannarensis TaxID=2755585 RepID=UPI0016000B88|nr:tetratricopeptide repeat protein [Rhodopirellula sp. JC639]
MEFRNYLTCLWPGLSELWWRGRLSALPLAIGFGIGMNSLLVLKYLYPTWLDPLLVRSTWWVGVCVWVCWTVKSVRELPALLDPRAVTETPDRFVDAQAAYLRGDWEATEPLLLGILAIEPRDPPALLMLSSVYRHTGRVSSARVLLDEMRRLEIADRWQIEIDAEAARIARQSESGDEDDTEAGEDRQETDSASELRGDGNAADLTAA